MRLGKWLLVWAAVVVMWTGLGSGQQGAELKAPQGIVSAEQQGSAGAERRRQEDQRRLTEAMKGEKSLMWVFTGDSITHGVVHTYGMRSYSEHFAERVRYELQRKRDLVINTGISGHRVGDILDDYDWRIGQFRPDVVFIMIGTNDCVRGEEGLDDYETKLGQLIDRIREKGGIAIVNTPNVILPDPGDRRQSLPVYVARMRKVAAEKGVLMIDHWEYWEKSLPDTGNRMKWLSDEIHPNGYGHLAMAQTIFRSLGIYDAKSRVCRLFVP